MDSLRFSLSRTFDMHACQACPCNEADDRILSSSQAHPGHCWPRSVPPRRLGLPCTAQYSAALLVTSRGHPEVQAEEHRLEVAIRT